MGRMYSVGLSQSCVMVACNRQLDGDTPASSRTEMRNLERLHARRFQGDYVSMIHGERDCTPAVRPT